MAKYLCLHYKELVGKQTNTVDTAFIQSLPHRSFVASLTLQGGAHKTRQTAMYLVVRALIYSIRL